MLIRDAKNPLESALGRQPAVVLVGPRQVGKTTLAHALTVNRNALYLDLENASDRAALAEPATFFRANADRLIVLDEIQRVPALFETLRGVIDQLRRRDKASSRGKFLLLGSASLELLKQSSESLAGRIAMLELTPLMVTEVGEPAQSTLWCRGGFPDSFLADEEATSLAWRQDFLRTYLERDIPQFGPRIAAETLRRLWTMLAYEQGGTLNASKLAQSLGVSPVTVGRYVDLLVDLLLVRRLSAYGGNTLKRLRKTPKVYLRDSGLVHALLGIANTNALLAHPIVGASWEGFVIEHILGALPVGADASYYRTNAGAEIDLVITFADQQRWVIEIKLSESPKVSRGFYEVCADLQPAARFLVYSGSLSYSTAGDVTVLGLVSMLDRLKSLSP